MPGIAAIAILTAGLWLMAGCRAPAPLPPRPAAEWMPATRDSSEWALKCDVCGKVYAHNTYRRRVSLAQHRKWAAGKGCLTVAKDNRTFDVCSPECRQKLLDR